MAELVEAKGGGRVCGVAGSWNRFFIHSRAIPPEFSDITVAFDGPAEPEIAFKHSDSKLIVFYNPPVHGEYIMHIKKDGEDIKSSPNRVKVEKKVEGNPKWEKIRVNDGKGVGKGNVGGCNEIIVNYQDVNIKDELEVSMKGPAFQMRKYGGPEVSLTTVSDGVKRVEYRPKFPGKYKLHLRFKGVDIPGSPFPVTVEGEPVAI